jgi:putative ABC transport system permease protein
MKFLPLIWKNMWRRKIRTLFTIGSVFVAFVLFGMLMTIRTSFTFGVEIAGNDRLVLIHKVSVIMPLPVAYKPRLAAVDGVGLVTHQSWFGGIYQDPADFFAQIVVEPEAHMEMYPEYVLEPDEKQAWLADRQGAVVGRDLAERFDWHVGDRIPLQATIWQTREGTAWEFNISGIYDGEDGVDKTQMFFHYDYLDENRAEGDGLVGWYIVRIDDASRATELAASFDQMFANSQAETKTTTEKGFIDGFAKQVGDIGAIMIAIVTAVLFNILLIAANTMAQTVRERTSELAVLKTLGFRDGAVLALVVAESLFVTVMGGGLGLVVAWLVVQGGDPTGGMLPIFVLQPQDLALGASLAVAMGIVAAILPGIGAMRLRITDALRRG